MVAFDFAAQIAESRVDRLTRIVKLSPDMSPLLLFILIQPPRVSRLVYACPQIPPPPHFSYTFDLGSAL